MSDQGYLSKKREEQIAKILDSAIDFDVLFKDRKKFLGVISIGNFMERKDRKIFEFLIALLDDQVIGTNPKPEVIGAIETAIAFLEQKDVPGFANHIADILSGAVETPFGPFEKQMFLGVLMMFNGIIGKAIILIEQMLEKADQEGN